MDTVIKEELLIEFATGKIIPYDAEDKYGCVYLYIDASKHDPTSSKTETSVALLDFIIENMKKK